MEQAQSIGDLKKSVIWLGNIGLVYKNKGDLDAALKYYEDALKIDRDIGYKQGEANHLSNIGIVYCTFNSNASISIHHIDFTIAVSL